MTQLICLIQAANLKDGRRVGENQPFETDEAEAEILIRGGIAKPAPAKKPAPVEPEPENLTNVKSDFVPEPVKEAIPATVVEEPTPVSEPSPKKIISKRKR